MNYNQTLFVVMNAYILINTKGKLKWILRMHQKWTPKYIIYAHFITNEVSINPIRAGRGGWNPPPLPHVL